MKWLGGAAALLLAAGLGGQAQAAGRSAGRPIQFTPARSDEVLTNLHQLSNKKDSLKRLEEDLNAPLQSLAPRGALEGVPARVSRPSAPSAVQSKRARELLERRKNWIFMAPEDIIGNPTVEQVLEAPEFDENGQIKKDLPAIESYYLRLLPKRPARPLPESSPVEDVFGRANKPNMREAPFSDDADLPAGIRESADALRSFVQPREGDASYFLSTPAADFSLAHRLHSKAASAEQMLEHNKRMDEYRTLVDPNWRSSSATTPGLPALSSVGMPPPSATPANKQPADSGLVSAHGLEAQMNIRNPLLGPPGLPDVNAKALGQSRPLPVETKVRQTKMATTEPMYTAPRRAF
ncbi:MAG TPA: hypothetical protein PKW12_03165 [Verrucomicrobiota bacterium]|nr:hypothetical protein [Verrucomicrobiota bacterium]